MFADFVDIKSKLRSNVRMRIFIIRDRPTVLFGQIRKLSRYRRIDSFEMADRIAHIVRERPDCKGKLVRVFCFLEKTPNKICRSDVVRQVAEKPVTEWVIAEILNGAAAVSVGMGPLQFCFGRMGKAAQQIGFYGAVPVQIDQLLMRLHRVSEQTLPQQGNS